MSYTFQIVTNTLFAQFVCSAQDDIKDVTDPVDLKIRFKDVEFEAPTITFESLRDGGHPMDILAIQEKIEKYKCVVRMRSLYCMQTKFGTLTMWSGSLCF